MAYLPYHFVGEVLLHSVFVLVSNRGYEGRVLVV